MNKTFKVIFSRVRSSYVVANEITRSAKKKGTKALLIAAALTLSSASYAGGLAELLFGSSSNTSKVVSESTVSWNSESAPSGQMTSLSRVNTDATEYRVIDMQEGARGSAQDLTVSIDLLSEELSQDVYGIYNGAVTGTETNANFSGNSLSVTVKADANKKVAAVKVSKNTFITAESATLTAESKTSDVCGLHVTGSGTEVGITGNTTISSKHNERTGSGTHVYGIFQDGGNELSIGGEGKAVSITADSSADDDVNEYAAWIANGATFNATGSTISLKSSDVGLYALGSAKATLNATGETGEISIVTKSSAIMAWHENASVALNAKKVLIDTDGTGIDFHTGEANSSVTVNAETIEIDTEGAALNAEASGATLNLTATNSLEVTTGNGAGLLIDGSNSSATLTAKTISIVSQKDSALKVSKGTASLKAQDSEAQKGLIELVSTDGGSNTTVLAQDSATVSVEADNLVITHINKLSDTAGTVEASKEQEVTRAAGSSHHLHVSPTEVESLISSGTPSGVAIGSYSGANVTIKAATEINAPIAISVAGGSSTSINTDAARKTTIKGDVVFGSNANLEIGLSGSESSWTGRAYQSYESNGTKKESVSLKPTSESATAVTGFALKVSDGATWTLSEGESFVNNLTLSSGGKVDATNATVFNAGRYNAETGKVEAGITVEGKGNTLTLGDTTKGDITIEMEDASELITPLTTAFTLTKETVKDVAGVVTDAAKRFTATLKEGAKSAAITINEAFTVTTSAFAKMNAQFSGVTLNLAKMTLAQET